MKKLRVKIGFKSGVEITVPVKSASFNKDSLGNKTFTWTGYEGHKILHIDLNEVTYIVES